MRNTARTLLLAIGLTPCLLAQSIPWPAPEMWPAVESGSYGWGSVKQNVSALPLAKTFHLQSALPPDRPRPLDGWLLPMPQRPQMQRTC
jgi:hypothetical protein